MFERIATAISQVFGKDKPTSKPSESPKDRERKISEAMAAFPSQTQDLLSRLVPEYALTVRPFLQYRPGMYTLTVLAVRAEEVWRTLHANKGELGFSPVVLSDNMGDILAEPLPYDTPAINAPPVDGAEYFHEQMAQYYDQTESDNEIFQLPPPGVVEPLQSLFEVQQQDPASEVRVLLVPSLHGYDLFSYISYGGWNDCADDNYHKGILKYWNEKYGAELAAIGESTVELYLEHPVMDEQEALYLAKEQAIYCSDVVGQVTDSYGELARKLCGAHFWYFWWD